MRVLFVDDEIDVLEGLENRLHRLKDQWRPAFANSAQKALSILATQNFDAVVTDMRMPQMDGAELLNAVRREYPKTVRIILSGETGQKGLIRAISVAHRVLSKPCDIHRLHQIIEDTMRVQNEFDNDPVLSAADSKHPLPSAPKLLALMQAELRMQEPNFNRLAEALERDPAMTARLLQVVNSAMFGFDRPATNVREAIRRLGLDMICGLIAAHELYRETANCDPALKAQLDALHQLSTRTAEFAAALTENPLRRPLVFTAAILQSIGALALLSNSALSGLPLDTDLNRISSKLMDLWGLPAELIATVSTASHPSDDGVGHPTPAGTLHLARLFALRSQIPMRRPLADEPALDRPYLELSGLTIASVEAWEQQLTGQSSPTANGATA